MGILYDFGRLLKRDTLSRVELEITAYPDSVFMTEEDASQNKNQEAIGFEEYFWKILGAGRDFEAVDFQETKKRVTLLIDQKKTSPTELSKAFQKGGIEIKVVSTRPIRCMFGIYRF